MRRAILDPRYAGVLLALLVTGCKPDLLPINMTGVPPPAGFCRIESGKLVVTVKNAGSEDAPATTTAVYFGQSPEVLLPTDPIPTGGTKDLPVDIPPPCFHPDCSFRIKADFKSEVPETNEANNAAAGICIG